MPMFDLVCRECQWERRDYYARSSEDRPTCPNGHVAEKVWTTAPAMIPDTYTTPQVLENLGHEPVTVYSRSERKRELAARGLQEFVRHVGTPGEGSDKSRH